MVDGHDSGPHQAFEHWIGGKPLAPSGGRYLTTSRPIDRTPAYEVPDGDEMDVDLAVRAAAGARHAWAATTPLERSRRLAGLAAAIRGGVDALVEAEMAETGKLRAHAELEILASADYFEYYGGVVRTLHGTLIDQGPATHTYVRHEPFGVVGVITPWNAALNQAARSLAPALAAGNTTVVKPSEFTSATTLIFARLASESGLPDGVINVVSGTGPVVGAALAGHEDVRKVVFTGSVASGRAVGHVAADRIIPVTLELGGKSPLVVFADADLDGAGRAAAMTTLFNAGQVCSATTRLIAEREIQDALLEKVAEILRGKTPGVDFGPIITECQFSRVLELCESAVQDGATAVIGGGAYSDGVAADGRFLAPTVYRDVTNSMRVAREEVFGPVLVSIPFEGADEAVAIANDTPYGLAAAVWSGDVARGLRVAERIEAGQVSVNGGALGQDTPFGGFKQSGVGREKGADAIYEYTQAKTISLSLAR